MPSSTRHVQAIARALSRHCELTQQQAQQLAAVFINVVDNAKGLQLVTIRRRFAQVLQSTRGIGAEDKEVILAAITDDVLRQAAFELQRRSRRGRS